MNSDGTLLEGSVVLDSYFDPSLDLSCKRVKLASGQIVIYGEFSDGWFELCHDASVGIVL